jgi:hypothetical protein
MAAAPIAPIEAHCVTPMGLPEGVRQRRRSAGHGHEMDVIRHQAPAQNRHPELISFLAQNFDVEAPIVFEQEDVLAVVAPLGGVMRNVLRDHPGLPRHWPSVESLP